jgi:hypothetical protein
METNLEQTIQTNILHKPVTAFLELVPTNT